MKIKNIRIHNRPAYNSEVHGTRDMGVGELNNCYEDAELADTIFAVGCQLARDADQLFPESLGAEPARDQRRQEEGRSSATSRTRPRRIVIVDPRRTPTIAACEAEAGTDNVLHLAINSGTDLALFNALLTEIAAKGWVDRAFIAGSTSGFDEAVPRTRPPSRRRPGSPASSPTISARRRSGLPSPNRAAPGGGPCSPTRRG